VLVRRHTPLMLRVARTIVGQREAAEDVVQDTWVAVLLSVDGFAGRSTFTTWLMRILVNTALTRRSAAYGAGEPGAGSPTGSSRTAWR
jgi:RNA polymerase sigma-70 factor (ECF subfamily)